MAVVSRLLAFALLLLFACASRSPFTRPPSAVAIDEPCRFMGTVHKESRQRLEVLRACAAVSLEDWSCMAGALKELDLEFTALCRTRAVAFEEIASRQRELYRGCLGAPRAEVVECAVLSEDVRCLQAACAP